MAPSIISTSPPSSPTPYPSNPVERVGLNEEYEADENTIEPIAVVGLSLKFPDDATSPESFWNLLMEKRCASREIPSDRANLEAFYHSDGTRPDAFNVRSGHFVSEDLGAFDAPFFSISPAEAVSMDPQHRNLLETAYRALENAGIPLEDLAGTNTGVYTGSFADDYKLMTLRDPEVIPKHAVTGGSLTMLAARLSWFFDLKGPCVNLDTACSSSMMALDLACQALRNGECSMALVGGANTIHGLESWLSLSNMGFLSPDGRCYSFDSRANGYARGEGFGVVILKPLSSAIESQDTIRGIIRATGSNQDGRTPGITQPSGESQEALIRSTYRKAGLNLKITRFFEAHGTGTALGDPTECAAIASVFGPHRTNGNPLYIGAVKSNIGHLEGASGIAGFIKALLVLEKGVIPPNSNFAKLNPRINATAMHLAFPTTFEPFPTRGLRRASVNSFGFGGTNSHAVLDDVYNYLKLRGIKANHCTVSCPPRLGEYDNHRIFVSLPAPQHVSFATNSAKLLVLSSFDEGGISRQVQEYASHFKALSLQRPLDESYMDSLAHTLTNRRTRFSWRAFAVCRSLDDLTGIESITSNPIKASKTVGLAMVFNGQGSHYATMGKELIEFPVFRNTLLEAQDVLYGFGCRWSLLEELFKPENVSRINSPDLSQPLCTALQCALVELLRSVKVFPSAVIGHSSGEIAAAYAAGGLSLSSAMKVAYFRGVAAALMIKQNVRNGAMLAVGVGYDDAFSYLRGINNISIACYNGPNSLTISGDAKQIAILQARLDRENVFNRLLKVNIAYHSESMLEIAEIYLASLGTDNLERGCILDKTPRIVSSVYVKDITIDDIRQPQYWVDNLVNPVKFEQAISMLLASSDTSKKKLRSKASSTAVCDILEIGPHATLQSAVKDILAKTKSTANIRYTSLLYRKKSAVVSALSAIGFLYCSGYNLNLDAINRPSGGKAKPQILSNLPEYCFDHSRTYWYESRISRNYRFRESPRLELLGSPVSDWNPYEPRWRNFIRISEMSWVLDHQVNGQIVYPATGMLVMAVEAARKLARHPIKGFKIKEAILSRALIISNTVEGVEVQTQLRPVGQVVTREPSAFQFACYSFSDGEWHEHCRGSISIEYETGTPEIDNGREMRELEKTFHEKFSNAKSVCTRNITADRMYEFMRDKVHINYGPSFQGLKELAYNDHLEAIGEVDPFGWLNLRPGSKVQDHIIHPTTMDAVAQLIFVALTAGGQKSINTTVPTRIENLWLSSKGPSCQDSKSSLSVYAKSASLGLRGTTSSVFALNKETNELILAIGSLQTTDLSSDTTGEEENEAVNRLCFGFDWKPDIDILSDYELKRYCESSWRNESTEKQFYADLTILLYWYIDEALESLAASTETPMQNHLKKFVKWMRWQIERYQNGSLRLTSSSWSQVLRNPERMAALANQIETTNTRGKFFVKVGQVLKDILYGKIDPLEVIFNDDLADEYYREMFDCTSCTVHIQNYVDLLAHKNPALKILEIGGGTGGFTTHILRPLSVEGQCRYQQYTFTDLSPSFFERIKDKYPSELSRMDFRILDIETDPKEQGFEYGTYDLVVAGSVLHATADMRVTLLNVRKLLKPGGKLIIFEIVEPDILRAGFVFGLLEGWWLSKEPERVHGPCISVDTWDKTLTESGFTGTDIVLRDYQDNSCHETSIIVSTLHDEHILQQEKGHHIILTCPNSAIQHIVATELQYMIGTQCCEIVPINQIETTQELHRSSVISLIEISSPIFPEIDPETFGYLKTLLSKSKDLLWVTGDASNPTSSPELEMVTGLARSLRSERRDFKFATLALGYWERTETTIAKTIKDSIDSSKALDSFQNELEYRRQDGYLCIPRIRQLVCLNDTVHKKATQHKLKAAQRRLNDCPPLTLTITTPGSLNTLCFIEDELRDKPLGPDEVEIEVHVVDINFMDVLTVMGQLNQNTLGGACAGVVKRIGVNIEDLREGDRVAACILGCMKTYARQQRELVVRIPNSMSFSNAAALPCTFVTAYHGLVEFARLQYGETILIHSGAGGTGQAAIQLAQSIGAEIYTTVGSSQKKAFLVEHYNIPDDHIFYSRSTTFAAGVMRMTQQRGVDVVFNSLSDDKLIASWECMAPFGRFIEIGKKDIHSNSQLPMNPFAKNVSFHCLDLATMSVYRPRDFGRSLRATMDLASKGKLHPSKPISIYPASQVSDAFRYLQSGKSLGKTVIEFGRDEMLPTLLRSRPSYEFDSNATYVIAGGLGGLGRSIARWMVGRGAKHLLLLSRSGPKNETQHALLEDMERAGVQVEAPACDITSQEALRATLKRCAQTMPPIKGCIQGTMVLQDCVFDNMSQPSWQTATRPKVQGSSNLHTLLPPQLDFFILLSSISGTIGSPAQSNYAAGNTYQDALAKHLLYNGHKAVALDLGWMSAVGYVAENERAAQNLRGAGFLAQIQQKELFGVLEHYCNPQLKLSDLGSGQVVLGLELPETLKEQGKEVPDFMLSPAYRCLHVQTAASPAKAGADGGIVETRPKEHKVLLEAAESCAEGAEIVADALIAKLSRTLGINITRAGSDKALYEYGVDSLSALEIKNWCGKALGADVSVLELLSADNFGDLSSLVAKKSKFRSWKDE